MVFCNRCGNYAAGKAEVCPKCGSDLSRAGHTTLVGGAVPRSAARTGSTFSAPAGGTFSAPADPVPRLLAAIIDELLKGVIFVVGIVASFMIGDIVGIAVLSLTLMLALIYEPYFVAARGATPGKSSMSLQVVNVDGGPVSAGQSVARFILKLILNGLFIPIFIPLFTERRQGLHDMIVGTLVVKG